MQVRFNLRSYKVFSDHKHETRTGRIAAICGKSVSKCISEGTNRIWSLLKLQGGVGGEY